MIKQFCARVALALSILVALTTAAMAQTPMRKNIDLLSADELAAYKHAIQILIDRSNKDPFDKSGYLWQAWIHNCPFIWEPPNGAKGSHNTRCDNISIKPDPSLVPSNPGVCEHHKDLFLIWHRAQFYYFEKILQATDPKGLTGPSTSNVTVPFWNWTRKPSGVRYAKAFEDKKSPLYHEQRNHNALTPQEQEQFRQVTSPLAVAALVYDPDWQTVGGYAQEAPVGGTGLFEAQHHDPMHSSYFGGDMASPATAALDPAFFSFHAYIDLVFQFWIEQNGTQSLTSLDHFLRATQPDGVPPAPGFARGAGVASMGQGSIYLDPGKLGYGYEVTAEDRLPSREAVAAVLSAGSGAAAPFAATAKSRNARLSGPGLFDPRAGAPTMIAKTAVAVPATVGTVQAVFRRPENAADVSFLADFYLHPSGIDLDLKNTADREKYIVIALGHMGSGDASAHGTHQDAGKPLYVDLTRPLKDLANTGHAGENWTLTAVISGQPPSAFGTLSLAQ